MSIYIQDWDVYFFNFVYLVARKSKDIKTKIGSILVKDRRTISTGYNNFPKGINDNIESRYERPIKYFFTNHSEENAILQCASHGISSAESILYTMSPPCSNCTKMIINAQIKEIIVHKQHNDLFYSNGNKLWEETHQYSLDMLKEANIPIRIFDGLIGCKTMINGQIFEV